jgi:hypothetical protein
VELARWVLRTRAEHPAAEAYPADTQALPSVGSFEQVNDGPRSPDLSDRARPAERPASSAEPTATGADEQSYRGLLRAGTDHRLAGLALAAAWRQRAGWATGGSDDDADGHTGSEHDHCSGGDDLPSARVDELRAEQRRQGEVALLLERSLVHAVRALQVDGVTPLVLKGLAAAHLDHIDPGHRTSGDVDLLVRPDEIDRAVRALIAIGGTRDLPPRTASWDRRFAKDIAITDRFGVEIDVHRTLVQGPFGAWIDLEELHRDPDAFELGGAIIGAPRPAVRALHAVYGLTIAEATPRLAHAVDLCLAVGACASADEIVSLARRCRASGLLDEALELVATLLDVAPVAGDGTSLEARPPKTGATDRTAPDVARRGSDGLGPMARWARRRYRTGGGSNTGELLAAVLAQPGIRERLGYLRGLVVPDRSYRRGRRQAGRPQEWRRGLRELLRPR